MSRVAQLLTLRDASVWIIAQQQYQTESMLQRKPTETVKFVLEDYPNLQREALLRQVKGIVATEEEEAMVSAMQDLYTTSGCYTKTF